MEVVGSPDTDRGWAVVVLICVCISRVVLFGICYSGAIIYSTFIEDFQESPTLTSWAVNMILVSYLILSQVGNVLSRLVGIRTTIVIGCLLSSVGILATSFVPTVRWLFLTYGLLTGIGFSFVYITQFYVVAQYFIKYRKIAFSIVGGANSLGQFVYSPLMFALFERFHWRSAFIILSAINLHILLLAAVSVKPRQSADDVESLERLNVTEEESDDADVNKATARSHLSQLLDDLRLLRNVHFLLYFISCVLLNVGQSTFLTHIVSYSKGLGHSGVEAAFLSSIMAIANLISRSSIGVVLHVLRLSVPLPYISMFTIAGILMGIYGLVQSYIGLAVMTACIGFLTGAFSMFPEFAVFLVGVDKLSTSISFLSIASAIGFFIGGPLSARLYEIDPSYFASFAVAGMAFAVGGLINLPIIVKVNGKRVTINVRDHQVVEKK